MPKCVMCQKDVTGFYDYEGEKIPVCFEHYEDGTFANYLATQQPLAPDTATPCDNCGTIGAHDCSEPDNHPAIPPCR